MNLLFVAGDLLQPERAKLRPSWMSVTARGGVMRAGSEA
jgi:hypothetical protein